MAALLGIALRTSWRAVVLASLALVGWLLMVRLLVSAATAVVFILSVSSLLWVAALLLITTLVVAAAIVTVTGHVDDCYG